MDLKTVKEAIQSAKDYYHEREIFQEKFGFGEKPALITIHFVHYTHYPYNLRVFLDLFRGRCSPASLILPRREKQAV